MEKIGIVVSHERPHACDGFLAHGHSRNGKAPVKVTTRTPGVHPHRHRHTTFSSGGHPGGMEKPNSIGKNAGKPKSKLRDLHIMLCATSVDD